MSTPEATPEATLAPAVTSPSKSATADGELLHERGPVCNELSIQQAKEGVLQHDTAIVLCIAWLLMKVTLHHYWQMHFKQSCSGLSILAQSVIAQ